MQLRTELFEKIAELKRRNQVFAIATVIRVKGSSSGKVGDKAVFGEDGRRITGWIGGGCIENRVSKTALEAFEDGMPRIVNINLDSDWMGMGIPCGGHMSVIVEPQLKTPVLLIRGMGRVAEVLCELAALLNFNVIVQTSEEAARYPKAEEILSEPLELDELEFTPEYFVLAAHHRDDDKISLKALRMHVPFVAVLASRKKTGIIIDYLKKNGITDRDLERLHAPAGLDLKARSAEEISLSIVSEMVMHRNGGTGKPMKIQMDNTSAT